MPTWLHLTELCQFERDGRVGRFANCATIKLFRRMATLDVGLIGPLTHWVNAAASLFSNRHNGCNNHRKPKLQSQSSKKSRFNTRCCRSMCRYRNEPWQARLRENHLSDSPTATGCCQKTMAWS
jgi:hypothetical protein